MQTPDWLHNLKICMQFQDSENAQCNLEFAQISRFRGTEIKAVVDRQIELDDERSVMQLHAMLTNNHDINVSLRTVLRCRTSLGWTFRGSAYCQLIRETNEVKHLEWCQRHPYSDKAFKDVIFTDECTVQLESHREFACRRISQPKPKPKRYLNVVLCVCIEGKPIYTVHVLCLSHRVTFN